MSMDWLDATREQFAHLSARLPHAILLSGEAGLGKSQLAIEMIASVLCDGPKNVTDKKIACRACDNCQLFEAGSHPDFHYLSTEQDVDLGEKPQVSYAARYTEEFSKRKSRQPKKVISVDQVRALINDFCLSHHSANMKVALIDLAQNMNINAANALLKLLEEPNPQSLLLLVASDISRLPMTIRSRCVALKANPPSFEQGVQWLQVQGVDVSDAALSMSIASGAPIKALAFCQQGETDNFAQLLNILETMLGGTISPIKAREALLKLTEPNNLFGWLALVMRWMLPNLSNGASASFEQAISNLKRYFNDQRAVQIFQSYDEVVAIKKQDMNVVNIPLMLDRWLITLLNRFN